MDLGGNLNNVYVNQQSWTKGRRKNRKYEIMKKIHFQVYFYFLLFNALNNCACGYCNTVMVIGTHAMKIHAGYGVMEI